jgi:diguanylate cyclase
VAGGDWRTRLHLSEAAANAAGYDQELKDAIRDAVFAHARLAKPAVNSKTLIQGLHHVLEMVRADSLTDGLTGVANRRRFDQVLEMETAEAAKSGDPLCLALADVDHFKRFNGTFGRQTGGQVLRVLTQTLKMNIKGGD